jgi:hypothetical protein
MLQGGEGRNHNPHGFPVWLAGTGGGGAQSISSTAASGLQNDQLFFER